MKNKFSRLFIGLVLFTCLFFCSVEKSHAEAQPFFTLTSSNISFSNNSIQLELFFSLPDIERIEKMLISGVSINIDCFATLNENKAFLPDSEIQSYISGWQLRYQSLTHEFLLYHENENPLRSRDLKSLLHNIFSKYTLSLNHLPELDFDGKYTIDLTLGLRHATVPPWLEKTLFFWTWDIAKDSYLFTLSLPNSQ